MPGGRPRKPSNLAYLHGDQKSRINQNEPIPAEGEIVPPFKLTRPAARIWKRLAPDRIAKGVLTPWDVEAFAAFCEALALIELGVSEARGPMLPGCASPMSRLKDAVGLAAQLGSRFGWTPSDRAKLTMKGSEDDGKGASRLLG